MDYRHLCSAKCFCLVEALLLLLLVHLVVPAPSSWGSGSRERQNDDEIQRQDDDDESNQQQPPTQLTRSELEAIRERIIRSLGITKVPDGVSEADASAEEREEAYRLYYQRLEETQRHRLLTRDVEHYQSSGEEGEDEDEPSAEEETGEEGKVEDHHRTRPSYTFQGVGESADGSGNGSSGFPVRLRFSSVDIPREDGATFAPAMLRLLRRHSPDDEAAAPTNPHRSTSAPAPVLQVFQLKDSAAHRQQQRTLVANVSVGMNVTTWDSIDLSAALAEWRKESNASRDLVLELDCVGCADMNVTWDVAAIRSNDTAASGNSRNGSAFLDVSVSSGGGGASRPRRSADRVRHGKKRSKKQLEKLKLYEPAWTTKTDCSKENRGKCCRHRMYVNFTLLDMKFVIEPKGFDAYYCKGKCPPLYNPAHTHALIQSRMHGMKLAPKPCCAPSKLSNLTLMYRDENNKYKVTDWANAVVEECACS